MTPDDVQEEYLKESTPPLGGGRGVVPRRVSGGFAMGREGLEPSTLGLRVPCSAS